MPSGGLAIVLGLLVLPPVAVLIGMSFADETTEAFTLVNYARLFASPRIYASAFNSLQFALGATVVALALGATLAWIVERTNAPLKPLAHIAAIMSLGTPHILYVSAWLFLLGRVGPLNDLYRQITGTTDLLFNVYSMTGMILIQGFIFSPLVFLMLSAIFRRSNGEMEEAARICGASVWRTVSLVSLQLARPALVGIGLLVFIRNLESFDVPVLVGTPSRISFLTTDVYLDLSQVPRLLGHASAYAVVLLILVGILLYFYGRVSRHAERFASMTGKGFRPRAFDLGRWRWFAGIFVLLEFLIAVVVPGIGIVWVSLMPFARPINFASIKLMKLSHYANLIARDNYIQYGINTIIVSALAATLVMLLTMIAAWVSVRRWPGGTVVDQLANVPLIFPAVILGVAMVEIALNTPFGLYNTLWVIALAFLVRYLPFGMRYAYSGVIQIHRELEEAAGVCGANQRTILRRIVAPLLSPSLLAGWLFVFLLGGNELSMAVLLAGSRTRTIAVALFDELQGGQAGDASALGVVWTLVMTGIATTMYFVGRKQTALARH